MDSQKNINYKKVLIVDLGGIGDILLSTPAIRALRNLYPEARISMLVTKTGYKLAKDFSFIDNIFIFEMKFGGRASLFEIINDIKILLKLRAEKFDLAINMRTMVTKKSAQKINLLFNIIAPRVKAGRNTGNYGYFFDIKIPEPVLGAKYEMEYDIDLIKALGVEEVDKNINLEIDEETGKEVDALLEKEGISKNDKFIVIHPGGMNSRRWPLENFAYVVKAINKETGCKSIISAADHEKYLASRLKELCLDRVISLADKINVKQLAALIKRSSLFICNDTGPMHIAAALKAPLIAIFGSSDITRFDPRNIANKAVVFYEKSDCSPCEKAECPDMKCMKAITPEEVAEEAVTLLKRI